jgi:hypothetical protein
MMGNHGVWDETGQDQTRRCEICMRRDENAESKCIAGSENDETLLFRFIRY